MTGSGTPSASASAGAAEPENHLRPAPGANAATTAILDRLDWQLSEVGRRDHRFSWLLHPDTAEWLVVDGYYPGARVVVIASQDPRVVSTASAAVPANGLHLLIISAQDLAADPATAAKDLRARLGVQGWPPRSNPPPGAARSGLRPAPPAPGPGTGGRTGLIPPMSGPYIPAVPPPNVGPVPSTNDWARPNGGPNGPNLGPARPNTLGPTRSIGGPAHSPAGPASRPHLAPAAPAPLRPPPRVPAAPAPLRPPPRVPAAPAQERPGIDDTFVYGPLAKRDPPAAADHHHGSEAQGVGLGLALVGVVLLELILGCAVVGLDSNEPMLGLGFLLDATARVLGTIAAGQGGDLDGAWTAVIFGSPALWALSPSETPSKRHGVDVATLANATAVIAGFAFALGLVFVFI